MSKEELVQELIRVSMMKEHLMLQMRALAGKAPPIAPKIIAKAKKTLPGTLEGITKCIAEHHTEEMLQALIKFYSSDIGQEIVKVKGEYEINGAEYISSWIMESTMGL